MWELENRTSLVAERGFARDTDGSEVLVVVVKGTYAIAADGKPALAEEQTPILRGPVYAGDPPASPLVHETDFCLRKPATDVVVVNATAHAPAGEPTIAMEVGFSIGPLAKRLAVIGDRTWIERAGRPVLDEPRPFTSMPLGWERAYGGRDGDTVESRNPCGTGFASSPASLVGKLAPNLAEPGALVPQPDDRPEPRGFSPIARSWQPRLAFAGTLDETWRRTRMPLVPGDYDARFEQCAPVNQQVAGYLRGGEPVELTGMSPNGTIRARLPSVRLSLATKVGRRWVRHDANLYTVVLEPTRARITLVWHSTLPCQTTLHSLRRIVIDEEPPDG